MDLEKAAEMARDELDRNGLCYIKFEFDGAKRRLGNAQWKRTSRGLIPYKMTMSKVIVELNPEKFVREIILHEVAHLMLPYTEKHGQRWRAKVIELGGNPTRTFNGHVKAQLPHAQICRKCGTVFPRARLTWRMINSTAYHSSCGPDSRVISVRNFGKLTKLEQEAKVRECLG